MTDDKDTDTQMSKEEIIKLKQAATDDKKVADGSDGYDKKVVDDDDTTVVKK